MSANQKKHLRELAGKATKGKWHNLKLETQGWVGRTERYEYGETLAYLPQWSSGELNSAQAEANAAYIASANPQAVIALLDEIDGLRVLLRAAEEFFISIEQNPIRNSYEYKKRAAPIKVKLHEALNKGETV